MRYLIIILCLSYLKAGAQSCAPVSINKFKDDVIIFTDTVHHKLIASSKNCSKVGNLYVRGVASWDGTHWDSLSGGINTHNKTLFPNLPDAYAATSAEYNGKLLVGGDFFSIGYVNATDLALWDGTKWDSLPKRAFRFGKAVDINALLKKNGLLYIVGRFDTIAGQPANGLATWDGVNFTPIILPIHGAASDFSISSIVEYNNEIYICGGTFNIGPIGDARDIFKYNGTAWLSATGTGFYGGYDGVGNLIVYKNELYACGHMRKSNGNPGENIIKWDGTTWKDVGFGNTPSFINLLQMKVFHNQLWVFGGFSKVAGKPASNIAVYDGTTWCALPDTFQNYVYGGAIYRDTMYISGGFRNINGDTNMAYVAKIKYPSLFNNCKFTEPTIESYNFNLFPNPFTDNITIQFSNDYTIADTKITLTNNLGQLLLVFYPTTNSQLLNVASLASGMYYLTIQEASNKKTVKVIKQ